MKIFFADSSYDIDPEFINFFIAEIKSAYEEVTKLLPFGSSHINFFVQPREYNLIAETQDHGYTHNSDFIELAFNPALDETKLKGVLKHLKGTVFHEMNHAARYNMPIFHTSLLDTCIMEGLATVFERDYAHSDPLWGHYPDNVADWLNEIRSQDHIANFDSYLYSHPDGRRWIAYKVGTYIIDEAMRISKKTVLELSELECSEIMHLAKF